MSIVSCTSSHDKMKKDISTALKKANESFSSNHPDSASENEVRVTIEAFVQKFPDDSLNPVYLFELAQFFENRRQYDSALKTLGKIYSGYPHAKQASQAVFHQGFIYSEDLKQYDLAREKYQLYIDEYSSVDAKMTNDAKFEIEHLGKSPEEILKEIQAKAHADSVQAAAK